jgi:hypothetical protein
MAVEPSAALSSLPSDRRGAMHPQSGGRLSVRKRPELVLGAFFLDAFIGGPGAADMQASLGVVRNGCHPFQVMVLGKPGTQPLPFRSPKSVANCTRRPRLAHVAILRARSLL